MILWLSHPIVLRATLWTDSKETRIADETETKSKQPLHHHIIGIIITFIGTAMRMLETQMLMTKMNKGRK
jgi:hypothetical protein